MQNPRLRRRPGLSPSTGLALIGALALSACSGSDGRDGNSPDRPLPPGTALPGFHIEVLALEGGSGAGGAFRVGDTIRVRFTVEDDAGDPIPPADWSRNAIYLSGPSFAYQRVLTSRSDMVERTTVLGDGTLLYTFAEPIPATYAEPYNYTGAFTDGVFAGQPLLSGTYTIGIEARTDVEYSDGTVVLDLDNTVAHLLFGDATATDLRAVAQQENCQTCHDELSAHGGNRTDFNGCLLCHTSGAEDRNDPAVADGTPGVGIDFRIMIHKIHSGAALPSVLGMGTDVDGNRDYTVPPKPYRLVGFGNSVHDFSHVLYPRWPSLSQPMPRDTGYGDASEDAQRKEDLQRQGPVDCASCHGDPDGDGPLEAPADGRLIYSQPSIDACASCHDDWDPERSYRANLNRMPPQPDNSACTLCHKVSGGPLDVETAHIHPLLDPAQNPGLRLEITALAEAGMHDDDGTLDTDEAIDVTFTITDDAGNAVDPGDLSRWELTIAGPTANPNLLHLVNLASSFVDGAQPYTLRVPEVVQLERAGLSTGGLDTFSTDRAPLWDDRGAPTSVWARTASAGNTSTLAAPADARQNFVDVQTGDGAEFDRNDYVVLADGVMGQEEYFRIQWVDGDRLWLGAVNASNGYKPALAMFHDVGTTIESVTLTPKALGTDYSLDLPSGAIREELEFGDGAQVVVSYTTDFLVPATYPGTLNQSPGLDSSAGDWTGLPVASGTYQLNMSARTGFTFSVFDEDTDYWSVSPPTDFAFLVGDADEVELPARIDSPQTCYACHVDIEFHGGGRRGYASCAQCHTVAGAEDRPRYVAPGATETPGTTIDFRTMLHKIHHGRELTEGADYVVNGFGLGYPDNFTAHTYEHVGYPVMPDGTADCASCHGTDNDAWPAPAPRDHPDGLGHPTRSWYFACTSCHDGRATRAHAETNTSAAGEEACATCHGPGRALDVRVLHGR